MNKLLKTVLTSAMVLALGTTVASADTDKGQKLFAKKLKSSCGMSGAVIAVKHT